MRTFQPYWQNLFYKIPIILIGLGLLTEAYGAKKKPVPGVIESLEALIKIHKSQFFVAKQRMRKNISLLENRDDLSNLKIDPYFMRSIIFNTEKKYLSLIGNKECNFYSLLQNNLLRSAEGDVNHLMVTFKTKTGLQASAYVSKNDFLKEIYKSKCIASKEFDIMYSKKNFKKTFNKIPLEIPKTQESCLKIYDSWKLNPITPYLCRIPSIMSLARDAKGMIKETDSSISERSKVYRGYFNWAKFYKKNTTLFQRSYLKNMCGGLEEPEKFCNIYLAKDSWTKILNGELPLYYLKFKCQNVLGKKKVNTADLKKCAKKFFENPEYCLTKGNKDFLSYFPLRTCDKLSETLNISRIKSDYHDCPGNIDNGGITNIHRIIMHLDSKKLPSTPNTCTNEANNSLAEMIIKFKDISLWPLKVCFRDPILETEVCRPYVPGNNSTSKISEGKVVAGILARAKGAPDKMRCKIVSTKQYNPARLSYQVGCFIVFPHNKCTTLSCPKKIYWNRKEISGIKYQGSSSFKYFPTSIKESSTSTSYILETLYKIRKKELRNLTAIYDFFNNKKNGIIHGVGCIEDMIPHLYRTAAFNECKPVPFIIDGYKRKNKSTFFSLRLAIDDVHTPRLINWNNVFNAVTSFKRIHPMDLWALYGIDK